MTRRKAEPKPDPSLDHGNPWTYSNARCRCQLCRKAWAKAHYEYMHADPSRLAKHRERQRQYRLRRKAQKDVS